MMKNKTIPNMLALGLVYGLFSFTLLSSQGFCANYSYSIPQPASSSQNSLQGSVTYIPEGSNLSIVLSTPLSSVSTAAGSLVNAQLTEDFIYNNKVIAQKGSTVTGSVIKVKKAGFGNRNAQLQVVFNNILTTYGQNIPINAVIRTDDNSGVLKGGAVKDAAKDYAKSTTLGAGAGAVLGTAMGAMSGGSVGRGAIYGTALGGGLGLAKGAITKGGEVYVPQNACFNIFLTQPLTLNNNQVYYNY